VRFVKVETIINGDDGGTWVNVEAITAIVDYKDRVLVVTPSGTYRSDEQDAIDILSGMNMIVNEETGIAVSGLDTHLRAKAAERGLA
jgi:hypothetical protein